MDTFFDCANHLLGLPPLRIFCSTTSDNFCRIRCDNILECKKSNCSVKNHFPNTFKAFCGKSCGGSTEKDQDWFEICTGTIESPFVLQMESTLEAKWDGDSSSGDDGRIDD